VRQRPLALALAAAAALAVAADRPPGLGDVTAVRHWSYPDYTRVVVELTRPIGEASLQRLGADSSHQRPERLFLDLDGVWVGRRYEQGIEVGDGLLRGVRLGQNTRTRTRVVIDLERYERHRLLRLHAPERVVIDVYGSRELRETLRWPSGGEGAPGRRLSMPLRAVRTVVIDAGHGGRDTGAIGLGGTREKDVNLRLAHKLAGQLERDGFQVILTREGDQTLSLEERTALAEASGGDVFVSLHANAAPRRSARGVEIYYLDQNHQRHSLRVAARENGVPRNQMDALQRTLAQLRVSEASIHSRDLADKVQREIATGLTGRGRPFVNLGVKQGPFYVLFLSSMPAILVEAGFVTNREDVRLLRDERQLDALADAIARGLVRYREGATDVAAGAPR
jgi:N-acetylmuramoyl-L-alanine amidase